jgi:hypothetical protein
LKGKQIINKTGWGIAISRMAKALVLEEYGMKILGHYNAKKLCKVSLLVVSFLVLSFLIVSLNFSIV